MEKQNMTIDELQNKIKELVRQVRKLETQNKYYALQDSCYYSLFEYLSTGCITLNSDAYIMEANPSFRELTGFKETEIIGTSFLNLLSDKSKDKFNKFFITAKETTEPKMTDLEILGLGKQVISIRLVSHSIVDNNATFMAAKCLCFNVSEMQRSKEQLKTHEMNLKLKDELIINKELELKKQNIALQQLNNELKIQCKNVEELNNKIVENEYRLKLAFDSVNDGVWDWNIKTNATYFSDRFYSMLDYEPFEFPHTFDAFKSLIHPNDLEIALNHIGNCIRKASSGYSIEFRMKAKLGNYKWILSRGSVIEFDSKGAPIRLIGTHVDITQQKETEFVLKSNEVALKRQNEEYLEINQKLSESNSYINTINQQLEDKQAQLNSILKAVPAAIGLISGNTVIFVNEQTAKMTGYSREEILGCDMRLFHTSNEEYERICSELFSFQNTEELKSIITKWKTKEGKIIDVQLYATPIDPHDLQAGITYSAVDITAQKRYEADLIQAKEEAEKADKLKSSFLANMSHEIRTPMNGIVGFSELLRNKINHSKKEEYISIIVNSSKQLLKIITDIIDISKVESGEVEVIKNSFSLHNLLQEEYNNTDILLKNSSKNQVELKLVEGFIPSDVIVSDPSLIQKILSNLLNNAVKFTEAGFVQFGYNLKGKDLEFYVLDTGIGLDEEEQKVIFERFRQVDFSSSRKFGGNGLGLAIANSLVKLLEGNIWVESRKEEGSVFYFTIPYVKGTTQVSTPEPKEDSGYEWEDYHILVVEDDIVSYSLIKEILEQTSIRITHVLTGIEAVEICKKDDTINLVLMDIRLPELDGYEATKYIKENKKSIVIIAQTAHAFSEDREKCMKVGCDEYLSKPIKETELFAVLEKYLQ
jgi:PAS domain S-box-containing protein